MIKNPPLRLALVFLFLFCSKLNTYAQSLTLEQLLSTPFIADLVADSKTGNLLLSVNNKGARNIYLAAAPTYQLKQLTQFNTDEGQEITSLQISNDGEWAVFVKGGDHGGNSTARPINPNSSVNTPKLAVYSINLKTAAVKLIGEGNYPSIHPNSKQLTFINEAQIQIAAIDGSVKPKQLFFDRGLPRIFRWSPDGKRLAFGSRRTTHSFIGIYEEGKSQIKWVAPSYHKDDYPTWSPDGKQLAFIRQEGESMGKDSASVKATSKWQAYVYDLATSATTEIYKSSTSARVVAPRNLNWSNAQNITFSSYEDGWPHLYAIDPHSKKVKQLTKGNFATENYAYSANGNFIAFCANYAKKDEDVDRKQLGIVDLVKGDFKFLTSGDNIFSTPSFINGDKSIVALSSTAKRPVLPAIVELNGKATPKIIGNALLGNVKYEDLVVPEHVRYTSPDGLQVYGQLFKPKNIKDKAPAIVYIHGGPRRQMYLGWHHLDYYFYNYAMNQYLASQGYVVLSVNYRSGTGYGYAFQNAARAGRNGASEYQDILAAGNWLAQQDFVNADKIGVYGGSHGGFLTAMALAKNSDVFKVGVDIHGVHMRLKAPGNPASLNKNDLAALHSSPSYWVDGWKSPALIIHGDDDQNVNFQHSIDLYNRLKNRNVDIELLIIPDETHHWMVFKNLLEVNKATFNFLHKYLK
ncbi:prolyl oligopeptidase family serine peptidase [Pedobacter sp. UBA4863]|mgnify:CR=1 FL=1|uniref:S9 family peptidase n=1 Tax=Pedobacter sp. UBA4863 TaxID=1947060 RepID=UPI0025DF8F05|nr:prolyl oligopeptidase family serine peptidase [Pedobacter sp. UBA4863]